MHVTPRSSCSSCPSHPRVLQNHDEPSSSCVSVRSIAVSPSPIAPFCLCIKSTATLYQVTQSLSWSSFFSPPASCKNHHSLRLKGCIESSVRVSPLPTSTVLCVCYRSIESSSPITPLHSIASYILSGKSTSCLPPSTTPHHRRRLCLLGKSVTSSSLTAFLSVMSVKKHCSLFPSHYMIPL